MAGTRKLIALIARGGFSFLVQAQKGLVHSEGSESSTDKKINGCQVLASPGKAEIGLVFCRIITKDHKHKSI